MSTIAAIREGLTKNLKTIPGLRVDTVLSDILNPPVAIISLERLQYSRSMANGNNQFTFKVTVVVGRQSERSAQETLDLYCAPTGAKSIKAAIESDMSLNGSAWDVQVPELTAYGVITSGEVNYLSAEFSVTVFAS